MLGKKRGTTLIEIMIYVSAFAVVLFGIYGVLILSLKYYRAAKTNTELQQSAITAFSSFTGDITDSSSGSVLISTNPQGVMFPSPKSFVDGSYSLSSSGNMQWQSWYCYYLENQADGTKNLVRKRVALSPVRDTPGTSPYTSVYNFANDSSLNNNYNKKTIARGVSAFSVARTSPTNKLHVVFTVDGTTDTTKQNKITLETDVLIQN